MKAYKGSKKLKIVVFSPDMPFPPNRGGRADIWRRIEAFRCLGHDVMLVNLQEPNGQNAPGKDALNYVDTVVSKRFSFPIKRGIWITVKQLACSWLVPWHAANRIPSSLEKEALVTEIDDFCPDFLWVDGPWFSVISNDLAKRHDVPILYRSHNVEHLYLKRQARAAVRVRDRVAWTMACIGLRRFEIKAMERATVIFDISVDDLAHWKAVGIKNSYWLPPLPELAFRKKPTKKIASDLLFVGNLSTPNNIRGVEWLLTKILPLVHAQFPNTCCRIVGSSPTIYIKNLIDRSAGAELNADVPDSMLYLFGAKVLVNPVMTGSGVQIKMLDMLMTDAPIITHSQGARGLPEELKTLFRIADDARSFAEAICEELRSSSVDIAARAEATQVFSLAAVERALEIATNKKRLQ